MVRIEPTVYGPQGSDLADEAAVAGDGMPRRIGRDREA